ncbi:MAG: S9 family peptidase [Bacteroidales bacterium]|jgi:dipeptidyl aminopeptidase/acylaminoacyl peptidase|nr:S9 family peptidase [Bacteroidales bacterium]
MKTQIILAVLSATMLFYGCKDSNTSVIGKPENVKIENRLLSPEALWAFGRLGEVAISPCGKKIAYSVRYYDIASNKGNTDIYVANADGTDEKQVTKTVASEFNLVWRKDGRICFLRGTENGSQIFEINPDGTKEKQISNDRQGIDAFLYSPDETKIALVKQTPSYRSAEERYPDLPKASGLIFNDLNYRHWDEWVTTIPHVFVADVKNGKISGETVDLLQDEPYEAPLKPFDGIEQVCWQPDGSSIVYSSKKLTGKKYAQSTNSDLYIYTLKTGETRNITEGMFGYDKTPQFSPDGKYLVWQSMERDGYESDKNRLFIMDMETGEKRYLTEDFDQNVDVFAWAEYSDNAQQIYFVSNYHALSQIYSINITTKEIKKITDGIHDYINVIPASAPASSSTIIFGVRQSMSNPSELYAINEQTGEQKQVTHINDDLLARMDFGTVKERWLKTTTGEPLHTWVIYPPYFDSTKTYPTLLYLQGGPQSTISQFWSYRWNFQIMAANDYIIVAPNRHGLPGFGQKWNEQISGDYGGQNQQDVLKAIDELCKEPYVDKDRLGCVGASYGAFAVYWMAGNHNKRFKGFIAHDGMFNFEQQYLETEEMFFADWDLGGNFWDKGNAKARKSYAQSPHLFVQNWDAPILIIHGEKDYRILASQGMAAFNAAVLRDIPAELLIFPDENHWVLKPQNGILWQRRFFKFLDTHVKKLTAEDAYYAEKDAVANITRTAEKEINTETQVSQ